MGLLRHTKLIAKAGLAKVRRAVLGPWATAVLCDSPVNGKILVPAEDLGVGRRLAFGGAYDPERVEMLLGLLSPGRTCSSWAPTWARWSFPSRAGPRP